MFFFVLTAIATLCGVHAEMIVHTISTGKITLKATVEIIVLFAVVSVTESKVTSILIQRC